MIRKMPPVPECQKTARFHIGSRRFAIEKRLPSSPARLCRRIDSNSQSSAAGQHLHSFGGRHGGESRKQGAHLEHLEGSESKIIKSPNVPTKPPVKYHIISISSFCKII
jgi:hypothetical protein